MYVCVPLLGNSKESQESLGAVAKPNYHYSIVLPLEELDKANKDKKHYSPEFSVSSNVPNHYDYISIN